MKNKKCKKMIFNQERANWVQVDHERFHKCFNVRNASIVKTETMSDEGYALTVFSMNDNEPEGTHMTEHNNGFNAWPDFYVNKNAKKISGVISLTADQLRGK